MKGKEKEKEKEDLSVRLNHKEREWRGCRHERECEREGQEELEEVLSMC